MPNRNLLLLGLAASLAVALPMDRAHAQVGVSIGINLGTYPELVPVPGLPAYYAPGLSANYFFDDGLFWLYSGDSWYESAWYNGPWVAVGPDGIPLSILRIPVRYYREPPRYFDGWEVGRAPRWNSRWGADWTRQHQGWERAPVAAERAPLPLYQRNYEGARYPGGEQREALLHQNYHYRSQGSRQFEPRGNQPQRMTGPGDVPGTSPDVGVSRAANRPAGAMPRPGNVALVPADGAAALRPEPSRQAPAQPMRRNLALPPPIGPETAPAQPARQNLAPPQPVRPNSASLQPARPNPGPPPRNAEVPGATRGSAEGAGAARGSAEGAGRRPEAGREAGQDAQDRRGRDDHR